MYVAMPDWITSSLPRKPQVNGCPISPRMITANAMPRTGFRAPSPFIRAVSEDPARSVNASAAMKAPLFITPYATA